MTNTANSSVEYPSEIHRLLKIGGNPDASGSVVFPHGLPTTADKGDEFAKEHSHKPLDDKHAPDALDSEHDKHEKAIIDHHTDLVPVVKIKWKNLIVYPAVFLGAFLFFYTIFNFSALLAQVQSWFVRPQNEVILGEASAEFYDWIGGYYFAVNNVKLLDPNNDIDKDGLSNMDEFVMRTNPTIADSDNDGYTDGMEVIHAYNPWGMGVMTASQTKLAEKMDSGLINNRIGYNAAANNQPGASGNVLGQTKINYDISKPGKLSVPRLNIQVPIIWSQSVADFDADLQKGVIHYPGTSMPGETGVVYVSGHSSDYIWNRNQYGNVFATINRLQPGDDVFVELYGADGKTYNYRYQVSGQKIHSPDDQTQFMDTSANKLNLSTCWPLGTSKDRLVVSATQVPL